MDQAVLVNMDIERGSEILSILDRAKIKVSVALWAHLAEYEDWRFVLLAKAFDELELRKAYRLLNESLSAEGMGVEKTPVLFILPMTDPFVKELRKMFSRTKSVEGMRLGGQLIGGRFLKDAFVYRVR